MHRISLFLLVLALAACKREAAQTGTPASDARAQVAPPDAHAVAAPALDAAAMAAIADAAPPAAAPDAGAPDAGTARKPKPPPIDARAAEPPPAPAVDAAPATGGVTPCHRTKFETKLVADACADGGQGAAKKAMKAFLKTAKTHESTLECKGCHESLAPDYPLKKDGLEHFKKLGGS